KKFFVYAPDRPGALDRRYEVRPRHFEKVNPLIESGVIQVAGMITDPETPVVEGERRNTIGSMLIVQAESIEAARELIMNDVYTTSGVWDKEKMVIAPFFAATPFP
ncbi:hypothetical protein AMATHDRAFT_117495, partial [Amanita thiersii Skay4041]